MENYMLNAQWYVVKLIEYRTLFLQNYSKEKALDKVEGSTDFNNILICNCNIKCLAYVLNHIYLTI